MGGADLHIHTTASDGVLAPAEVVQVAVERGLLGIAITDHDTTDGVERALGAADGTELEVIPGVELSAEQGSREVHLLGYYLDHRDQTLRERLAILRRARRERAWSMVRKLVDMGIPVSWEHVLEIAGETSAFGRPHIAQAMRMEGYVRNIDEAFDRYIGRRGPAYVARYKLSPADAVRMIRAAGGLPVLAHPWRQEDLVPELVGLGLVGLEVYYPRYSAEESQALAALAERHNLIATGGTDYHGYQGSDVVPGDVSVPPETMERLRALAGNRTPDDGRHRNLHD